MEKGSLKPYINIVIALCCVIFLLAFTTKVHTANDAGVIMQLPDRVGEWVGDEVRFCQNEECQHDFMASTLEDYDVCPDCGGELGSMSLVEKRILPADTFLIKKRYTHPGGASVFVSMVVSGADRASIHRPELCMSGQGNDIIGNDVLWVDMDEGDDLGVKVLNMEMTVAGKGTERHVLPRYYAYWFVGNGRETPHHWQRMFWMASDMIFRNIAHRWAYLSVSGLRDPDNVYQEQIKSFVHDFYPQVKKSS